MGSVSECSVSFNFVKIAFTHTELLFMGTPLSLEKRVEKFLIVV